MASNHLSDYYMNWTLPFIRTAGPSRSIEKLDIPCVPVEAVTSYPSILGGRVEHPTRKFGGILGRRAVDQDIEEIKQFEIPEIDLVIVDLYPFEETVASTNEKAIIEKIDIGGPSMIRGAAKTSATCWLWRPGWIIPPLPRHYWKSRLNNYT